MLISRHSKNLFSGRMKIVYQGQYFYFYSGPEYQSEITAEEFNGGYWKNLDDTKRTIILPVSAVSSIDLYHDLFEIHLYVSGLKVPRLFKFLDANAFTQFLTVLQQGFHFELI